MKDLALIIPACNEAGNIKQVVEGFSRLCYNGGPLIGEIVVVDNNSTDGTADHARDAGATVVNEPEMGYGRACQKGISYPTQRNCGPPKIVAFADGDGSADPKDLQKIITPIESCEADFVLGARQQLASSGSLTIQQRFGNWLACRMIKVMYSVDYSDLGALRAIDWNMLNKLKMNDMTYGWSIEMQVKAAKHRLRTHEVDVHTYPRTAGRSKVSGTFSGVVGAGWKIITTILKYR